MRGVIIVILALAFLFETTLVQRGGGGGVSRSGGMGRGFSGKRAFSWGSNKKNRKGSFLTPLHYFGILGLGGLAIFGKQLYIWISRKRALMRYRKNYYQHAEGDMSQEEFQLKSRDFETMLRERKFTYVQTNSEGLLKIRDVTSRRHSANILELEITGKDSVGSWRGEGAFMLYEFQPFFWMLKFYDDYRQAGQTGEWLVLVYESDHFEEHNCNGRWFYETKKDYCEYSGTWTLTDK